MKEFIKHVAESRDSISEVEIVAGLEESKCLGFRLLPIPSDPGHFSLVLEKALVKKLITWLYPMLRENRLDSDLAAFEIHSACLLLVLGDCPWLWTKRRKALESFQDAGREIHLCQLAIQTSPKASCIWQYLLHLVERREDSVHVEKVMHWLSRICRKRTSFRLYAFWTFRVRLMRALMNDAEPDHTRPADNKWWTMEWNDTCKYWNDSAPFDYSAISYRVFLMSLVPSPETRCRLRAEELARVQEWLNLYPTKQILLTYAEFLS